MKKLLLAAVMLAGLCSHAQTINPNQIRPGTNSQCLVTVAGVTTWTACPGSSAITQLNGPVTATGPGVVASVITPTGVSAGTYTLGSLAVSVNAAGQVTAIGSPFSFTFSCTAAGSFEIGTVSTNPNTCTYTYSNGTPVSATLSDGVHSTVNLTTPFTSGALAFAYSANTTFTGNAVATTGASAPTQAASFTVGARTFYGVGTGGGATSATASGNNAVLVGATGTLGTWGVPTNTGTVSVSPSTQYIYFLLSTGGHTFKVNGFTTTFTCSSISFTNQLSSVVSMQLCVSPTSLSGTYSVEVD